MFIKIKNIFLLVIFFAFSFLSCKLVQIRGDMAILKYGDIESFRYTFLPTMFKESEKQRYKFEIQSVQENRQSLINNKVENSITKMHQFKSIKLDGKIDDWRDIAIFASGKGLANPDLSLKNIKLTSDGQFFYILVTGYGKLNNKNLVIYLDNDFSDATGYESNNILGADLFLKSGIINKFLSKYQWKMYAFSDYDFISNQNYIEIKIPYKNLNLSSKNKLKISFGTLDDNENDYDWLPKTSSIVCQLK